MDITELLEEYGIEYWLSGKNVGKGWIGIKCPFCEDPSNHLGINLKSLAVTCWLCGRHSLVNVIMGVLTVDFKEAKNILKDLEGSTTYLPLSEKPPKEPHHARVVLPPESSTIFPNLHYNYLKSRGLLPKKTIKKYDLRACHTTGPYKFRIIIPIYMKNHLVYFTSRTIMPKIKPKYKNAPLDICITNPKGIIYNYDSLIKGCDAFAVEGPIDVWKLGDGAFSTIGSEITTIQLTLLLKKEIRILYIISDKDFAGRRWSQKIGRALGPICKRAEIITLENKKDAGELSLTEVIQLKKSIGFKHGRYGT